MIFQFAFELYLISTQEVHDADFNRTPSILLSDFFIVKLIYVFKNTARDVNLFFFNGLLGLVIHLMLAFMRKSGQESLIQFHGTTTLNLQEVHHLHLQ